MLCTFILEAGHKVRYESITQQDWSECELLYYVPPSYHPTQNSNPQEDFQGNTSDFSPSVFLQYNFCKAIEFVGELPWQNLLNQAQGTYISWIHPDELWAPNFLDTVREILNADKLHDTKDVSLPTSNLPVGYGFARVPQKEAPVFIGSVTSSLLKENRLYKNILQPRFYNPFLKYFFQKDIIQSRSLPYKFELPTWQERYAVFILQYILAVKTISGGREPDIPVRTLPFSLPLSTLLDTNSFDEYQFIMQNERQRIVDSLWRKAFWVFVAHSFTRKSSRVLKRIKQMLSHHYQNLFVAHEPHTNAHQTYQK